VAQIFLTYFLSNDNDCIENIEKNPTMKLIRDMYCTIYNMGIYTSMAKEGKSPVRQGRRKIK